MNISLFVGIDDTWRPLTGFGQPQKMDATDIDMQDELHCKLDNGISSMMI